MSSLSVRLESQRILANQQTVSERYFEPRFYRNNNNDDGKNSDECVLLHSNRTCLITLSPYHDIIKHQKKVLSVDFRINDEVNRLENKVCGKWKKGGQRVESNSLLCRVECDDNSYYNIYACIDGTIIEVNDRLMSDCSLVTKFPWSHGYFAIILPFRGQHQHQKDTLLTMDQYESQMNL